MHDAENGRLKEQVARIRQLAEQDCAEKAMVGAYNPVVAIFNLKNNFGWKDKTEQEVKQDSEITIKFK